MSLILSAKIPDAIIVASDRRITNTISLNEIVKQTPKTDNEQKTFLACGKYAISYCGNANIGGLPTSSHIRKAVETLSSESSTFSVAKKLISYWKENDIQVKPSLIISGYNDGEPSIIEINAATDEIIVHHKNDNLYGLVYHGETDICKALIDNNEITFSLMRPQDMIDLFDILLTTTSRMQALQERMRTVSLTYDLLILTPQKTCWLIPPFLEK